jgi:hypothetical protein
MGLRGHDSTIQSTFKKMVQTAIASVLLFKIQESKYVVDDTDGISSSGPTRSVAPRSFAIRILVKILSQLPCWQAYTSRPKCLSTGDVPENPVPIDSKSFIWLVRNTAIMKRWSYLANQLLIHRLEKPGQNITSGSSRSYSNQMTHCVKRFKSRVDLARV